MSVVQVVTPSTEIRDGRELASLADQLRQHLFALALRGLQIVCLLAVLSAPARTRDAHFGRTAALGILLAAAVGAAFHWRVAAFRTIQRYPAASLTPVVLAVVALAADGIRNSPLSFVAAVAIAPSAFVCGRRWALTAALLLSASLVSIAALGDGLGAVNSVGQGTSAYFVWALVLSGLSERFARVAMQLPPADWSPPAEPVRVQNLADHPSPSPPAPVAAPHPDGLTARQIQVVALLADGLRAKEIALALGISESTVYRTVTRAKERARVRTRDELVAFAYQAGLIGTPPPQFCH